MEKLEILEKILMNDDVYESVKNNQDIIMEIIPELKYEIGFDQKSEWHSLDVWEHTIKAISYSSNDFEIRLVMLLHDIGKPFSYQDDGDIRHFKNHAIKSAEIASPILDDLGVDENIKSEILFLIKNHSTEININEINNENILLYYKLLKVKIADGSAYEKSHSDMILKKLELVKKEIKEKEKIWMK